MHRLTTLIGLTLAGAAVHAAPPAATRPVTDRDANGYASKASGVTFRVSNEWSRLSTSGGADVEDGVFMFAPAADVTSDGAGHSVERSRKSGEAPAPRLTVMLGQPCERQKQLEEVVKDTRVGIAGRAEDAAFKFDRDEAAADVGGRRAWVLRWSGVERHHFVTVKNGKRSERVVDVPITAQKTLWLQNDTICDITLRSPTQRFEHVERVAERVRATLAWTEAK